MAKEQLFTKMHLGTSVWW